MQTGAHYIALEFVHTLQNGGNLHFELPETYGNPYGLLGRAALELMGLKPHHGQRNNGNKQGACRRVPVGGKVAARAPSWQDDGMPIEHLTPTDLEARTARAVAAATSAGRALGLEVAGPKILHDVFSVVVHLAPSPVVVRVPVVLPPGLAGAPQARRQARELAVVAWLAERGLPVVRPSPLVPCEPVQRDGFSMTFWEFVDVDASRQPDFVAEAALAADLHAALRDYTGELPFLFPITEAVPTCLALLEENPGLLPPSDLERAWREWAVLGPVLSSREGFAKVFPEAGVQPIHGDAPSYNIIRTASGVRYADFEDVNLGPVEWDLSFLGPDGAAVYNAAAARAGGRPLDPAVLRVMDAAGMLRMAACYALVPQLPRLAEWLEPSLQRWRTMPFAGGLG